MNLASPNNQPKNQPTNQPTNQPKNQPTNQPTNQPKNQPIRSSLCRIIQPARLHYFNQQIYLVVLLQLLRQPT
ncbi:MAG: PT domain-containing protein [Oscillatoriophycideae cyanobacterium NC_groundwater_1537_Pr4_S-0.65um_50_18]|nr:PT domain-containing protein [Oscillatoriophycideae cyanobacterium NC_groundwater_1537_Pr4_S-0.65um_50_18]